MQGAGVTPKQHFHSYNPGEVTKAVTALEEGQVERVGHVERGVELVTRCLRQGAYHVWNGVGVRAFTGR